MPQLRAEGQAVQARQLQVQDHDVVAARAQPLEGLPAVAQGLDLEALGPEVVVDQLDDVRVVLDDESLLHGGTVSISGSAARDSSGPANDLG